MKARLHARSIAMLAALFAVSGVVSAGAQPPRVQRLPPRPDTPRLVVHVFRSTDKLAGPAAADDLRERLIRAFPSRTLWVIPRTEQVQYLEQSGFNPNEQLARTDEAALAKLLRADEYIRGQVVKDGENYRIEAWIVLTRDQTLIQPLPPSTGNRLDRATAGLVKSITDARMQLDNEKRCVDLARQDKLDEAVKVADAAIVVYPQATLVRYCKLNVMLRRNGSNSDLIAMSNEILAIDANAKNALAVAADALQKEGRTDEANTFLVRLLATDPTNAQLASRVVDALAASRNYGVAKEVVLKAVIDNPGDVALVSLQFRILAAAGDFKPAIQTGEEMAQMDTSLADKAFFNRLSALYAADSQPVKAAEAVARATQKFPDDAELWQLYAQTLRTAGQAQQSIAAAKRALELNPKIPNGWTRIAVAYNELGLPDSALVALREAKTAGDDANQIGGYALTIGNGIYRAAVAEDPKKVISFRTAIPYLQFADSTVTDAATQGRAKFLIGVSSYYIAQVLAGGLQTSHSCDDARLAQSATTDAQIYTQAGGRTSPDAAAQILGAVMQLVPYLEQSIKSYCK